MACGNGRAGSASGGRRNDAELPFPGRGHPVGLGARGDGDSAVCAHLWTCPCCAAEIGERSCAVVVGRFLLVRCVGCGFMFVGNPASERELGAYYASEYGTRRRSAYIRMQWENAQENISRITRYLRRAGIRGFRGLTALDVGAGFGFLVAALRRRGFEARGIDPSAEGSRYARDKLGVQVCRGSLEELYGQGERFDLIAACDVIEHIPRPREFLLGCKKLLSQGGILVVKTDNFDSWAARMMGLHFYRLTPFEHVSLFTPVTLNSLACACGLECAGIMSWTPGYGIRWAIKHVLREAVGWHAPPLDAVEKPVLGPDMSLLGYCTGPLFAAFSPLVSLRGRGAEFMAFLVSVV